MKLKTILVDDELGNLEALKALLEYLPEVLICGVFQNPVEAISEITRLKPNLLLLDIMMPEMDGFELLKRLPEKPQNIIFITAANDRGIEAVKAQASDYLLKPVIFSELKEAVEKSLRKSFNPITNAKISIPTSEGYVLLKSEEIIRLKGSGSYCEIFCTNQKPMLISRNLGDLENQLVNLGFIRVHTSHLVNNQHILRYNKEDGGFLQMSDLSEIPISRRRKDEVLNWLKIIN